MTRAASSPPRTLPVETQRPVSIEAPRVCTEQTINAETPKKDVLLFEYSGGMGMWGKPHEKTAAATAVRSVHAKRVEGKWDSARCRRVARLILVVDTTSK